MDAQRFDSLAKSLAGRLTRRKALRRAGAAASATLLASAGVTAAPAVSPGQRKANRSTPSPPLHLGRSTSAVRTALQRGYIEAPARLPVSSPTSRSKMKMATSRPWRSSAARRTSSNFATAEANWIAQNLGDLLPAPDEVLSGDTYVYAGDPQAFRNTCPGRRSRRRDQLRPPLRRPDRRRRRRRPHHPHHPRPAPCTGQGCVCSTGTQRPCDGD